ncbi:MAG: glycine/sarcosine/betaine reductase component B subunit [Lachnospirales bacterium]
MGLGPSTKETTKHHFKDPLIDLLAEQEDLDFCGIIVYGTSDNVTQKKKISYRAGQMAIACRPDGVIISLDGWGNYHVDYENCINTIGKAGIPIVGLSFVGKSGQFVVKNKYMDTIVDINKSISGTETEIIGENNKTVLDSRKAIAMLKIKMNKEKIL